MSTWVSQAYGINKTAWRILAVDRLAITSADIGSDTLGSQHANLGHMVKDILNNRSGCSYNSRGNCKWAGEGLTEKFCFQDGSLDDNWSFCLGAIIPI
jgi:hypothetical protein